jgi:site-specific DNA-cytosine methylase
MRVLVACEYSGTVRDAFTKLGHDAWSCDILPTESPGNHIQDDILKHLDNNWDLMIAHPPCTYLSNAGIRWFNEEKYGEKAKLRKQLRLEALEFVKKLYYCNIPKICIENPVGYLNHNFKKPDQIVQPYFFGDEESKRTCFWFKNLKPLEHTKLVKPKIYAYYKTGRKIGKPIYFHEYNSGKDRAKIRSKFWKGIAEAMAAQWGTI